jgi:2-methylcitrate dehydratase PrpD
VPRTRRKGAGYQAFPQSAGDSGFGRPVEQAPRTGEELEARVEVNRGGPGNPLSDEELARKFHDNAVRSLPEERAAELAARTLALPDAQSVEDLTALLTSAGER